MLYSLVTLGLDCGVGGSLIALQNVSVHFVISKENDETVARYYVDLAVRQNNWTFSRVRGTSFLQYSIFCWETCFLLLLFLFVCLFYGSIVCFGSLFACFLCLVLRKWHRPSILKIPSSIFERKSVSEVLWIVSIRCPIPSLEQIFVSVSIPLVGVRERIAGNLFPNIYKRK